MEGNSRGRGQAGLFAHFTQGGLGRVLALLDLTLREIPAAQSENHQHLLALVHNKAAGSANLSVVAGKLLEFAVVGDSHGCAIIEDMKGKGHRGVVLKVQR